MVKLKVSKIQYNSNSECKHFVLYLILAFDYTVVIIRNCSHDYIVVIIRIPDDDYSIVES